MITWVCESYRRDGCRLLTINDKRETLKEYFTLFNHNPDDFLRRFIIVDDTWIQYNTLDTKQQSKKWTSTV